MEQLSANDSSSHNRLITIDFLPDICPICHQGIEPIHHFAFIAKNHSVQAIFRCPRSVCNKLFIANYDDNSSTKGIHHLKNLAPQTLETKVFSNEINTVSPIFAEIFNQAFNAESYGLDQICGCGYRKALEFLIKDYAISKSPTSKDDIENKLLSRVIKDYVDDPKVKKTAELAAWLGNDETHYIRTWTEFDIKDLKQLIKITVNWIESEIITADYVSRMHPE